MLFMRNLFIPVFTFILFSNVKAQIIKTVVVIGSTSKVAILNASGTDSSGSIFNYISHNSIIHVSELGIDSTSIGLEKYPFRNIQTAINYAVDGDSLIVHPGIYYENLDMGNKSLHLAGLNGPDATIIDGGNNGMGLIIRTANSIFEGFSVRNTAAPKYDIRWVSSYGYHTIGTGIFAGDQSIKPLIKNCKIYNNYYGVYGNANLLNCEIYNDTVGYSGYWISPTIDKCKFYQNYIRAIEFSNANNTVINNSLFYGNKSVFSFRADLNAWRFNVSILNSTVTNNSDYLIQTSEGNTTKIVNSIFYNNTNPVFDFGQTYDSLIIKNSLIQGGLNVVPSSTLPKTSIDTSTLLLQDPKFINSSNANYRLNNNSPAIGAGYLIESSATDLEGNPRPMPSSSIPDIGAYENSLGTSIKTILKVSSFSPTLKTCKGVASDPKTFTVSGTKLTSGIDIKANSNLEISTTLNGTYGPTISLLPNSDSISSTIIFVRLKSTDSSGITLDSLIITTSGLLPNYYLFSDTIRFSCNTPIISSFLPTSGTFGSTIIVKGLHFTGTTSVSFGGISASSFIVNSDSLITATVGTGSTGKITVANSIGTDSSTNIFNYSSHNSIIHISQYGLYNNGNSSIGLENNPFGNIQTAINYAVDGDSLIVHSGIYYENLDMGNKSLHLVGLNGPDATIIDGGNNGMGLIIRTANSIFEGFSVRNTAAPKYDIRWVSSYGYHTIGTGIFAGDQSIKPLIKNCKIYNNYYGVYGNANLLNCEIYNDTVGYSGYWISPTIDKCKFYQNYIRAIEFSNANNTVINNSLFYGNKSVFSFRADLNAWRFNVSILNSTVTNNSDYLIQTSEGNTTKIVNSIFYNNTNPVFDFGQTYDSLIIKNSLIQGGLNVVPSSTLPKTSIDTSTLLLQDPKFINSSNANYRLNNNSPAIGAGYLIESSATDLEGNPRPMPSSSIPDIGAYENSLGTSIKTILKVSSFSPTLKTCKGVASDPKTFTVSGTKLTSGIDIKANSNLEISTTLNGTYGPTISLLPNSDSISSTIIFVRLKSTDSSGITLDSLIITTSGLLPNYYLFSDTILNNPSKPIITSDSTSLISSPSNFYRWYLNNVLVDSTNTNVLHVFIKGLYNVSTSLDSVCWSNSDQYLEMSNPPSTSQTPFELVVYPNPASNLFYVDINLGTVYSGKIQLTLTDINGNIKMVYQPYIFSQNKVTLPLNYSFVQQVYVLQVIINGYAIQTIKILGL